MPIHIKRKTYTIIVRVIKIMILTIIISVLIHYVSITIAFFSAIFFTFVLFSIDSKQIAWAAISLLVCIPILLIGKQNDTANALAEFTFFLLVLTSALQITEFRRNKKAEKQKIESLTDKIAGKVSTSVQKKTPPHTV